MIDSDGFRHNVGIILSNQAGMLFWAKRVNQNAWQFPQGGIRENENPEQAMYRELQEETGLLPKDVELVGVTRSWLRYKLPRRYIRHHSHPVCIGQKQRWFALRLVGDETSVQLDACQKPEFDGWRWVDYWKPADEVVFFKREVYRMALKELESSLVIL